MQKCKVLATIGVCLLSIWLFHSPMAEGKRKRTFHPPPLKIIDISSSPTHFAPGRGNLELIIEIELPRNLNGADLLEVSSLISFPTKRSIRFLYNRQPVTNQSDQSGKPRIKTTLLWDGTDQTQAYVPAGTYGYEIRAKLMTNDQGSPRTKMLSLKARGTLEVLSPDDPVFQDQATPPGSEHVPFVSDESTTDELESLEGDSQTNDDPRN